MKILMLTNYFPPYAKGGQELRCSEVAHALIQRGHKVQVLTSYSPATIRHSGPDTLQVHQHLHLEADPGLWKTAARYFLFRKKHVKENQDTLRLIVRNFAPDAIFIWGMWNVHRSVPWFAEQLLPNRIIYNLSDYWPVLPDAFKQYWLTPSGRWLTHWPKAVLSRLVLPQLSKEADYSLKFQNIICVSRYIRDELIDQGLPINHARIIYSGVDTAKFNSNGNPRLSSDTGGFKLLYVGRLVADKGIQTAIKAMSFVDQYPITLDIVGAGSPEFEQSLVEQVITYGLAGKVHFKGSVTREQIPSIMDAYDSLLFPSEWNEPFARTPLEAMATGLLVIGTTTGGTAEILIANQTGLVFQPGNALALATEIERAFHEPELRVKLSKQGQIFVRENFSSVQMIDKIEQCLHDIVYPH